MTTLSPRLKLIFDQLRPALPVWDLCCDHGYLGLHAYRSQKFSSVHFVDQVPEIIDRLKLRFNSEIATINNQTSVTFTPLSGESLPTEVTGNVVIAGVGSYTIFQILQVLHTQKKLKAERIILCPQNDVISIDEIKKLPDFSYRQIETYSVMEKDRLRKVFVFDQVTS